MMKIEHKIIDEEWKGCIQEEKERCPPDSTLYCRKCVKVCETVEIEKDSLTLVHCAECNYLIGWKGSPQVIFLVNEDKDDYVKVEAAPEN